MTERAKKALITGITGQDGSYLADLLLKKVLKKGYEAFAWAAPSSRAHFPRL